MNNMPTCPYCHKELLYDEVYDEYNDCDRVYQYWIGRCPNCFCNFKWIERYDFTHFYDLKEEKEEELE